MLRSACLALSKVTVTLICNLCGLYNIIAVLLMVWLIVIHSEEEKTQPYTVSEGCSMRVFPWRRSLLGSWLTPERRVWKFICFSKLFKPAQMSISQSLIIITPRKAVIGSGERPHHTSSTVLQPDRADCMFTSSMDLLQWTMWITVDMDSGLRLVPHSTICLIYSLTFSLSVFLTALAI